MTTLVLTMMRMINHVLRRGFHEAMAGSCTAVCASPIGLMFTWNQCGPSLGLEEEEKEEEFIRSQEERRRMSLLEMMNARGDSD